MTHSLLLELFSEEIPARMQARAAEDLKQQVSERLAAAKLAYSTIAAYVTPRRLTLHIEGLPLAQPDTEEERRGPRADAPAQAIDGFLASVNMTLDQLEKRDTPKGTFYFATVHQKGRPVSEVIHGILEEILAAFTWPKSMRWNNYDVRWVRPLHSILCLFGGNTLPIRFGHLTAANQTRGHRFLAGDAFAVKGFADYREQLDKHKVVLDREERKRTIREQMESIAKAKGCAVKTDDELLEEVAGLSEWPVVLCGAIDKAFMEVPGEVLSTSMRTHQKYFSLLTGEGKLAPYFITVSNITANDNGAKIIAGNERVLRARLSDARFFWDQDRKRTLESRVVELEQVVFHAKLGTVREKVRRIQEIATFIARQLGADEALAARAALLCKADLTSGMVGEFPELQGIMGGYYAKHDGEHAEVTKAVEEHYKPLGQSDSVPTSATGIAVALADKLDSLVGLFAADEKPTGSKDPFALRRAALGIIRIIQVHKLRLPLRPLLAQALNSLQLPAKNGKETAIIEELMAFFADRLKVALKADKRHDLISAVFDGGKEDDIVRLLDRVDALEKFIASHDGGNLLAAYRRAANIVQKEEKKDNTLYRDAPNGALLQEPEEKAVFERMQQVAASVKQAVATEKFAEAMASVTTLREPLDKFFDKVTVNCDDSALRKNRLLMLSQVRGLLDDVANFGVIEG